MNGETKNSPVIRLEGIGKSFGTVRANHDITLDIRAGKIKALLGENGAGKSTLMSILAGRLQPDGGRILHCGEPVVFSNSRQAIRAGIGMVYQHFMLVDAMTVAENVFLGQEDGFWLRPDEMVQKIESLASSFGLPISAGARVADLSMGEKQRVEILKLLLRESRILIFDEPTAVLTPKETDQLFNALRNMAGQGKAIVFISHKLGEVMEIADDIAILRKGEVIDDLPMSAVKSKEDLARRMVGRDIPERIGRDKAASCETVLMISGLGGNGLEDIHLSLCQGEILGIVGVAGNGQKPLVETVCGLNPPATGTVNILGKPWARFFRETTWDQSLCYIPEDRQGLATCLDLNLVDNFLLTTRQGFSRGPWLEKKKAGKKMAGLTKTFDIRPPEVRASARQLSGGNLQKMVLAREFFRTPKLIVAEQPTQGLDIAAADEVRNLLLEARERAGILLVTGDLAEALAISDRIAVMYGGRIMDEFPADETEKVKRIGAMMAGID